MSLQQLVYITHLHSLHYVEPCLFASTSRKHFQWFFRTFRHLSYGQQDYKKFELILTVYSRA